MKVLLISYFLFSYFLCAGYFMISGVGWYHILDVVMHVDRIGLMGGEDEGRWRGRGEGRVI